MPLSTENFWYATKGDHVGTLTNVTDESDIYMCTPFMGWRGVSEYRAVARDFISYFTGLLGYDPPLATALKYNRIW